MITKNDLEKNRRQPFIDAESYHNTLAEIETAINQYEDGLQDPDITPKIRRISCEMLAANELWKFQIRYTGGVPLKELACSLDRVIEAYERCAAALEQTPNDYQEAVFDIDESMDDYVSYLNLLSSIILLRRVDLLGRADKLIAGASVYQQDAIVEDLLSFFIRDRPLVMEGYWGRPYQMLIDAIEADSSRESEVQMKKYVKKWYPSMKGQASFWGKHQHITPEYSGYLGYWAMCAAAFTYLLGLDDSSYRDEVVYPRDLVDYARSLASEQNADPFQLLQLRVIGGHACTRTGFWFTPARADSRTVFKAGDIMPDMPDMADASYGATIWQWAEQQ